MRFKKGPYPEKTIEQVAAIDPLSLMNFKGNLKYEGRFADRTIEVVEKLHHFMPVAKCCAGEENCEETARLMTVFKGEVNAYCRNIECFNTIYEDCKMMFPIDFRILYSGGMKRYLQNILEFAGAPAEKTEENCRIWVDSLVRDPEEIIKMAGQAGLQGKLLVQMPLSGVRIGDMYPIPEIR